MIKERIKTKSGIYIHIPFCHSKCLYCDFYSAGERIANWPLYMDSLIKEAEIRKSELSLTPETLYIGGGTPSIVPIPYMKGLIKGLKDLFKVSEWKEFTIEVNPEDISAEKCKSWRELGVDRISIGIQSLQDNELKAIGRGHSSEMAVEAVRILKNYFNNISIDVIFGLQGQTIASYRDSLQRIIELAPTHVSCYSLMLEEGTALTHLFKKKKITLPDEKEWLAMFEITNTILRENGYSHYEISNFAKPGYESRHNSSYWSGAPYLGLGPGAHSFNGDRIRRANPAHLKNYLNYFGNVSSLNSIKNNSFYEEEYLSEEEIREEFIMTRLRTIEGIDLTEFSSKFGENEKNSLLKKAEKFKKEGRIIQEAGIIKLSESAFPLSDQIISSLF